MAGSKLRARCKIRECRVPNICLPAAAWPGRRVWFFVVPAGEADERDKDGCRLDQVFGRWVGNVPQTRPSLQTAASCSSSRRNKKRMLPHPTPGKARSRSCELVRIQWQGCLRDDFSLEFIDSLQCTHCQTYDVEQASVPRLPWSFPLQWRHAYWRMAPRAAGREDLPKRGGPTLDKRPWAWCRDATRLMSRQRRDYSLCFEHVSVGTSFLRTMSPFTTLRHSFDTGRNSRTQSKGFPGAAGAARCCRPCGAMPRGPPEALLARGASGRRPGEVQVVPLTACLSAIIRDCGRAEMEGRNESVSLAAAPGPCIG